MKNFIVRLIAAYHIRRAKRLKDSRISRNRVEMKKRMEMEK